MTALRSLTPSTLSANELARLYNEKYPDLEPEDVGTKAIAAISDSFGLLIAAEYIGVLVAGIRRVPNRRDEQTMRVLPEVEVIREKAEARSRTRREEFTERVTSHFGSEWTDKALNAKFSVNGVFVVWIDATITQHQSYIDREQPKVNGSQQTIDLHVKAIRDIQAAGAKSLRGVVRGRS